MTERYTCPSVDTVWTQRAQYERWLRVWSAASTATGHWAGLSAGWAIDGWIVRSMDFEAAYGHDVAAACEALRTYLEPDAARWLHYGLCSSDITDAGLLLAVNDATRAIGLLGRKAQRAITEVTGRWNEADTVYRTHGQDAQVGGAKHRWAKHWSILNDALRAIPGGVGTIGLDGPTGTGGVLDLKQRQEVVNRLGLRLRFGSGSQCADRGDLSRWLTAVAAVGTACERFGTDIRLLATTGELREGRGPEYRGSSSMPHKQNPTRSERLCGLAPLVRGIAAGYAEAASSCWDSHSLEHSSAERVAFPLVTGLVGYMLTEVAEIAASIEWDWHRVSLLAAVAPDDSFAEKSRLVREGADGNSAWLTAAKRLAEDAYDD